jgi:hypothetical protein
MPHCPRRQFHGGSDNHPCSQRRGGGLSLHLSCQLVSRRTSPVSWGAAAPQRTFVRRTTSRYPQGPGSPPSNSSANCFAGIVPTAGARSRTAWLSPRKSARARRHDGSNAECVSMAIGRRHKTSETLCWHSVLRVSLTQLVRTPTAIHAPAGNYTAARTIIPQIRRPLMAIGMRHAISEIAPETNRGRG